MHFKKRERLEKKLEPILLELFNEGVRYGEDINYARDEMLDCIREGGISDAQRLIIDIIDILEQI